MFAFQYWIFNRLTRLPPFSNFSERICILCKTQSPTIHCVPVNCLTDHSDSSHRLVTWEILLYFEISQVSSDPLEETTLWLASEYESRFHTLLHWWARVKCIDGWFSGALHIFFFFLFSFLLKHSQHVISCLWVVETQHEKISIFKHNTPEKQIQILPKSPKAAFFYFFNNWCVFLYSIMWFKK